MKHLIVARYREDNSWYSRIPPDWRLLEVQKGRELPNTGREASSYLWAIVRLYDQLQPDDLVAFVQGNPFDHCADVDPMLLLNRPHDRFFPLGDYTFVCDADGQPHHRDLPVKEKFEEWLGREWPGQCRFVPGAQFVVPARDILLHPRSVYERLLGLMDEELAPWVMERLWPYLLERRVDPLKATFYCQATPATTYLRCELPARYLPGKVSRECPWAESHDDFWFTEHEGDAAVFQFAGDSTWAVAAHAMASDSPKGAWKARRVLVEADDNYFAVAPNLKKAGWSRRIGQGMHSLEGHASIVKWADGCVVTTRALADVYRQHNPNVYVCPNAIDPHDWPSFEKRDDGILRIGWFASDSHKADGPLLTRAFDWASRQPNVEVVTMGFDPGRLWRFRRKHIEWQDLPGYREATFELDIGVCPVQPNAWSVCRSDVKALEKTMGGAALILSDVPPYELWTDGENCLKAKDGRGFLEAVKRLVKNRDEVKQLAAAGREYVLRERTIQQRVVDWEAAICAD